MCAKSAAAALVVRIGSLAFRKGVFFEDGFKFLGALNPIDVRYIRSGIAVFVSKDISRNKDFPCPFTCQIPTREALNGEHFFFIFVR